MTNILCIQVGFDRLVYICGCAHIVDDWNEKVVILGDNLVSHFSEEVIKSGVVFNISCVYLPF